MNKKIVFFDIDGTLLNEKKELPESTKEAINLLRKNDVHVAIATGRGPMMYTDIRKELDIDCYVSYNGAYCVYDEKVVFKNIIGAKELGKLTKLAKDRNHAMIYVNADHFYSSRESDFIKQCFGELHWPIPEVKPDFYLSNEIYQVLLFSESENDSYYAKGVPNVDYIRWHDFSMDVLPKGGSKAFGIEKMISEMGYKMENVYAFGDGLNDVEMLERVGTGVAMGNASDQVKSFADHVTKDVEEDGIYHGLKMLQLI